MNQDSKEVRDINLEYQIEMLASLKGVALPKPASEMTIEDLRAFLDDLRKHDEVKPAPNPAANRKSVLSLWQVIAAVATMVGVIAMIVAAASDNIPAVSACGAFAIFAMSVMCLLSSPEIQG